MSALISPVVWVPLLLTSAIALTCRALHRANQQVTRILRDLGGTR